MKTLILTLAFIFAAPSAPALYDGVPCSTQLTHTQTWPALRQVVTFSAQSSVSNIVTVTFADGNSTHVTAALPVLGLEEPGLSCADRSSIFQGFTEASLNPLEFSEWSIASIADLQDLAEAQVQCDAACQSEDGFEYEYLTYVQSLIEDARTTPGIPFEELISRDAPILSVPSDSYTTVYAVDPYAQTAHKLFDLGCGC